MKKIYIVFIALLALVVSSCEQDIVLDLNSIEPLVVIDASLPLDEPCMVVLTKTQDYYDQSPYKPLSGAIITLTDNDGVTDLLTENPVSSGIYVSSMLGKVGKTYHLEVKAENKTYTSTSTLPPVVRLDSLRFFYFGSSIDLYSPRVYFQDPPIVSNYYSFQITVNSRRVKDKDLADDKYKNGVYWVDQIRYIAKDEKDDLKIGDVVTIEMRSIDKGAYVYYETMNSVAAGGATNPTSNIDGGALGFFNTFSSYSLTETLEEQTIVTK